MYCTVEDMKKLIPESTLIQLTDDESLGNINQARIDEAVASADAEINSYCGSRYSVPFTPVPDMIRKVSVDIAIYNLYSRKVEEIPETRETRYKNAIRFLEIVAKGSISIGVSPEPAVKTEEGIETCKTSGDSTVTMDRLKGF